MHHNATSLTDEQATRWFEAVFVRHSRRAFSAQPADAERLATLSEVARACSPWPDARVVLVEQPGVDVFTGLIGGYGRVTGAPHLLVVIAYEGADAEARRHAHAHAGYAGEAAVLEATALGLGTCWVGGFFSPAKVDALVTLAPGERVIAVSPVGNAASDFSGTERAMRAMSGAHKRKPLATIAPGAERSGDEAWPAWAVSATQAARLAPSAMNRQPWRLRLEDGSLVIARDSANEVPKVTRALDCGIAMLHAELGARHEGVSGVWEDAGTGLDVARFVPEGSRS